MFVLRIVLVNYNIGVERIQKGGTYMKKNSWIQVTNKKTYLFLLSIPIALIYVIVDGVNLLNQPTPLLADFITHLFVALVLVIICVYFFVRFNSYSHWYNPNHPKP